MKSIARVCQTPEEAYEKLSPGEILVSRTTNVNWTTLFSSIGGVVTEIGGVLCHAAVVAREMKIPAIVAVPNATQILDGLEIQINGTTGEIYYNQ